MGDFLFSDSVTELVWRRSEFGGEDHEFSSGHGNSDVFTELSDT